MDIGSRLSSIAALLREEENGEFAISPQGSKLADDTNSQNTRSMVAAWNNLEAAAWELISIVTPATIPMPSLRYAIFAHHCLFEYRVLRPTELKAFGDLHILLIQTQHSNETSPTIEDARRYSRLAYDLAHTINEKRMSTR